jgi:hypothetical protein
MLLVLASGGYLSGRESLIRLGYELRWYHHGALVGFSLLLAAATLAAVVTAFLLLLSLVGLVCRILSRASLKHDRR